MAATKMIAITPETKAALDALKVHPRETYDDVLRRLLTIVETREARVTAKG